MKSKFLYPISVVVTAAVTGIIGNRADDSFLKFLPFVIDTNISIKIWAAVMPFLVIVGALTAWLLHYRKALHLSSQINQLDERILRVIPLLITSPNPDDIVDRIIDDIFDLFDALQECGIALYKPDSSKNYLEVWRANGISAEKDAERAPFYIGNVNIPGKIKGLQGLAFQSKNMQTVQFWKEQNRVLITSMGYGDDVKPCYEGRNKRLLYSAMICCPILGESNDAVGVLCLYSQDRLAFDSENLCKLVQSLSTKFAAIIAVASRLTP
jgi:hypothetical protein